MYQRFTGDMDLLIDDTPENRKKLRQAFKAACLGDLEQLETLQFVPGWKNFHLNNGFTLDLMHLPLKGLEKYNFENCHQLSSIAEINSVNIHFLHIEHLIQNKKAVNRPKDQIDVMELEKIKKLRR